MPQGALTMLVLRVLRTESLHGYAIAQRIRQLSDSVLDAEEGSLYPTLQRMLMEGWVSGEWGISETKRRVRSHTLTDAGKQQLERELAEYRQLRLRSRPSSGLHESSMRKSFRRIHFLLNRRRLEQELEDEMAAHREMMTADRHHAFGNTLQSSRTVSRFLGLDARAATGE